MASSSSKVIVFGATGAVGSAASREARRRGASVWLAMRDTSKSISGLDSSEAGYTRIQADLSDPASLTRAVQDSSATAAFVYTVFGSQDHMASAFGALKSAGITYVVLLSSFTVRGAASQESNRADFIAGVHAQAEVALAASGLAYAAIRPAYFNTNLYFNQQLIRTDGVAEVVYPEVQYDFIAPEDIGAVCGAILAEPRFQQPDAGQGAGQGEEAAKIVYLCGPELMSQRRVHGVIAETIGKEIRVKELSEDEWREKMKALHMPTPAVDTLLNGMKKSHQGHEFYPKDLYEEARKNVERYKEAEPMTFREWVEAHKADFT